NRNRLCFVRFAPSRISIDRGEHIGAELHDRAVTRSVAGIENCPVLVDKAMPLHMFYEGETKYRGIFLVAFAFGASPLRGILSGFRKNLDDLSLIKPAEKGSRQLRSTSLVALAKT